MFLSINEIIKKLGGYLKSLNGFTLLEVMISLAIFSVVGLSFMKVISERLGWLSSLDQKIISSWVADNVLTEIKTLRIKQTSNWLTGKELMADRFWYWQSKKVKSQDNKVDVIIIEVRHIKGTEYPDFLLEGYSINND